MGKIKTVAIKAPGFGDSREDMMHDIAVMTGATLVSEKTGKVLSKMTIDDLGDAEYINAGISSTLIIGKKDFASAILDRVKSIENQIAACMSDYTKEVLVMRKAKLAGGVGIIRVGAVTETAMKEKKDRVDDALCATRAARETGVLPGGGIALLSAVGALTLLHDGQDNSDVGIGVKIMIDACYAPLTTILENANKSPDVIINSIITSGDTNTGYDARTGEFCNVIECGIIDPHKVTCTSLKAAASISGLLLTTNCMVNDEKESLKEFMEAQRAQG